MARIPKAEIERLKREMGLVEVARELGVVLTRAGRQWRGRCPFHDDKTPSFYIDESRNLWSCLGACSAGGSVVDFVMRAESVDFRGAVEWLKKRHSSTTLATPTAPISTEPVLEGNDQELLNRYADYLHARLKESPAAQEYLRKRGLFSTELVDTFRIGFCDRTLGNGLPGANRIDGAEVRGRLEQLGVLRPSGHETLGGCLTIPIVDGNGNVANIYGRRVARAIKANWSAHLYIRPHSAVFNASCLTSEKRVILTEALIDALSFWNAGHRNVVSAYGVNGVTNAHYEAFKEHRVEEVVIAFDADDAGDAGAQAVAQKLSELGIRARRLTFPRRDMDANDFALHAGSAAEREFGVLLDEAVVIGETEKRATEEKTETPAARPPAPEAPVILPSAARLFATPAPAPTGRCEQLAGRDEWAFTPSATTDRTYRVRGVKKNTSVDVLRVTVFVTTSTMSHVDTLNLYCARSRFTLQKTVAEKFKVGIDAVERELDELLRAMQTVQDALIANLLETKPAVPTMTEAEKEEALAFLRSPKLIENILDDIEKCGVVGEHTNKLVGYLAATSRKLEKPLAVVVQSSPAAGKSTLMDAILSFMPTEERHKYSAMTGQALYYMGETDLRHKILAVVEEDGAEKATYPLKLLQSEGELTIASTGKDVSGKLETKEYHVEGPVMVFVTTTKVDNLDEEFLSRCMRLSVDEDRAQTRRIHEMQRESRTVEGIFRRQTKAAIIKRQQNAQRCLRPLKVVNPYARRLTFLDVNARTRRDHEKYLGLIDAIALLHQHQRPVKTAVQNGESCEYIEVTLDDIALGNALAVEVLGRTLDELLPQTRKLLGHMRAHVEERCKAEGLRPIEVLFTERELREWTGWGSTQLRVHLKRLVQFEYVVQHGNGRGGLIRYELLYDGAGDGGAPFVMGLCDVGNIKSDHKFAGVFDGFAGGSRPHHGVVSGGSRPGLNGKTPHQAEEISDSTPHSDKIAVPA